MDESRSSESRTVEVVAEPTNVGRALAFGSVGLWLITLIVLASHVHIHGF
jgi:hypothetical protein